MSEITIVENYDDQNVSKRKKKRKHKKRVPQEQDVNVNVNLTIENQDDMNSSEYDRSHNINEKGDDILGQQSNRIADTEMHQQIDKIKYLSIGRNLKTSDTLFDDMIISQSRSSSVSRHIPAQVPLSTAYSSVPNLLLCDQNHPSNLPITLNSETSNGAPVRSEPSVKFARNESDNVEDSKMQTELTDEFIKNFPDKVARVMVVTWNMASISAYPEVLDDLIGRNSMKELCDIYLLCFQETTSNKRDLLARIQVTFGGHYVVYNHIENGSIFCVLVGRKKFIWNLALIGKGSLSTRMTTVTKGVAALSFQFFGNTFLFLGCHFSSDKGKNSLRIGEFNTILYSKELIKSLTTPNMILGVDRKNLSHYFDYTFWAGDLNFRILRDDVTVARLILSEIDQNDGKAFEELLENDELINSQTAGLIFQEFEEGRIMFLPTYRFVIQTDEYNDQRTPSYTDRILFRSQKSRGIECMEYNSVRSYNYSDHKPVYAMLEVNVEPQCKELLKFSGNYNNDIYVKCFTDSELKPKETMFTDPSSTPQSRMCSIQ